jgi:nucleoside-diphosphate-sugar epimerase
MIRMRVLVIGGTAFIGRATVQRLVQRGHDVTILHRRPDHDLGPQVHNIQADRGDLPTVTRALRDGRYDAVFDFAYDWQKGTPPEHVEAAARACGNALQRYVFMSSVAAYQPGLNLRETDPLAPDDAPNPYAVHKAAAERLLFRMHAASGFPVTTFRPPFVHGPHQPFDREQFFWDRMRAGRPIILPDGGETPMQWVFVSDLANACVRAIEVPEASGQAFNFAHREPLTQRSFVETLARVAGLEPRFIPVARSKIHAAGGQLMGGDIYFGDYLDLPPYTTVIEKAPRILGVEPTPLEAALKDSFAWYQEQPAREIDYRFEDRLLSAD